MSPASSGVGQGPRGGGGEDGGGQAPRQGDDGQCADVVGGVPAGEGGEGGLVEGGGHGPSREYPACGEDGQVGGGGHDEDAEDGENGAGGHQGARAVAVDEAADAG